MTYGVIHINVDLALKPGVTKRGYKIWPYCVRGGGGVSSWCHAGLAVLHKTCSGVGSCVCVCNRKRERGEDACVFLHLLKELRDRDLAGCS